MPKNREDTILSHGIGLVNYMADIYSIQALKITVNSLNHSEIVKEGKDVY